MSTAKEQLDLFEVHGLDRQGGIRPARQDIGAPREPGRRAAVPNVEREAHIPVQALTGGGRQTGAENHLVALAVLYPVYAKL